METVLLNVMGSESIFCVLLVHCGRSRVQNKPWQTVSANRMETRAGRFLLYQGVTMTTWRYWISSDKYIEVSK